MAEIILKDRNGVLQEYTGIQTIEVETSDGGTAKFLLEEAAESKPQLYTPSLTYNTTEAYTEITISNPVENGGFASTLEIYVNGELLMIMDAPAQGESIEVTDVSCFDGMNGKQVLGFVFSADGFLDSEKKLFETELHALNVIPDTIEDGYDYPAIRGGGTYEAVFNEKGSGSMKGFPPKPIITMGGEVYNNYVWNRDIGIGHNYNLAGITRYQNATLLIEDINGELCIDVTSTEMPQLDPPALKTDENGNTTITPAPYTESVIVYIDGEEHLKIQGLTYYATGDFEMDTSESGAWNGANNYTGHAIAGTYDLGRLHLIAEEETELVIRCVYDNGNGNASNYPMLSKLDTELSASYTADSSSKLQKSFYGLSSESEIYSVAYTIPEGEHFIDIKDIDTVSVSAYSVFGIAIYQLCNEKTIVLTDYEKHTISAIATAACSHSMDSEMVSIECQMIPYCVVTDRVLIIGNEIDAIDRVEIYINDTMVDSIEHTAMGWNVDLTNYPHHEAKSSVYIKLTVGDLVYETEAITADLSVPTPAVTIDGTTVTATGIVSQVTSIEVYIDDILYATYEYDSESGFSQDLADGLTDPDSKEPYWNVEPISGVPYGFELNSSGYYESTNKAVNNSYSLCKVNIGTPLSRIYIKAINTDLGIGVDSNRVSYAYDDSSITATFNCINYAESSYDFGILSTLDNTLTQSYEIDSSNVMKSFKGLQSASIQTVTYTVPAGEHFVYVKYRKDSSVNKNNDSLQFTVALS